MLRRNDLKNIFRTLPAVLALTGALFWVTPAPPVEAQDICVTGTVCWQKGSVTICVSVEICI